MGLKLDVFAMPTIPATMRERAELRPIGRSTERYQEMLDELRRLAVMCDEMGVDAFSTTEHHFHTEGGEMMPNPVLFFADLAARTTNLRLIPLSIGATANNPLRIAEDVALLDQMTAGRVSVAFARSYQKRWVQTMSQGGPTALLPDSDAENREKFAEAIEIIQTAWTQDAFDYDGKFFQVPFPHSGIKGWPPLEWTRTYGADGEIDENGLIRKIGVVPRPFQDPHPEIITVFTASPSTLHYAAEQGFQCWMFEGKREQFKQYAQQYKDLAEKAGHQFELGQKIGAVRAISIGDTYDEAFELACQTSGYEFYEYFDKFGFAEGYRDERDDPNKPVTFSSLADRTQRQIDHGYAFVGTVDDVKRELEGVVKCYGDGALEWLNWNFFYQGQVPFDVGRRQLEIFVEKIWPEFR